MRKIDWIKIKDQLPPTNTIVWVKRKPNRVEDEPIYLAKRTDRPITTNPDPSRDCYWYGVKKELPSICFEINETFKADVSFSDITVLEWGYYTPDVDVREKIESVYNEWLEFYVRQSHVSNHVSALDYQTLTTLNGIIIYKNHSDDFDYKELMMINEFCIQNGYTFNINSFVYKNDESRDYKKVRIEIIALK